MVDLSLISWKTKAWLSFVQRFRSGAQLPLWIPRDARGSYVP